MTTPSELYLLSNVDLDPNYNYTIDFDNLNAQNKYFDTKISNVLSIDDDYSYIKTNERIKVYKNVDELFGVNYLYYNNGNKRYYAFITNKEYVSATCTAITFKIDTYQTFMFDYSIEESFIDREHQDRYNKEYRAQYNLENENLDIGNDYKVNERKSILPNIMIDTLGFYIIKSSEPLGNILSYNYVTKEKTWRDANSSDMARQGDIKTGVYVYLIPSEIGRGYKLKIVAHNSQYTHDSSGLDDALFTYETGTSANILSVLNEDPRVLSIQFITTFNEKVLTIDNDSQTLNWNLRGGGEATAEIAILGEKGIVYLGFLIYSLNDNPFEIKFDNPHKIQIQSTDLNINNEKNIEYETKLFTNPYSYLLLQFYSDLLQFNYEYFDEDYKINAYIGLGVNNNFLIEPEKYLNGNKAFNKVADSRNEITLRTDAWKNYVLNNKASVNGGLIVAGAQTLGSIALSSIGGGFGVAMAGQQLLNYGGQVANTLLKRKDIQQQPDNIRQASTDIGLITDVNGIIPILHFMEILPQFKNKIFNYFYRYGYKCNNFKKPNTRSRYYFNYIKTIGANIKTNIDSMYRDELRNIFDNGITIWHYRDASTFKGVNNYDYENVETNLLEVTNV